MTDMAPANDEAMPMATNEEAPPKHMITILSQDKEAFVVEKGVATMATLIEDLLADVADGEDKIPLQNVDARILAKVIEYMKYHYKLTETPQPEDEVRRWDREFVRVDKSTLFHLVLAANYLNIQSLLDLTTQTVAELIKGKTPEQIRAEFGIVNDFTPEEEEEIKRDNAWSEDR